jgi:DNA-binding transcriptional ArsR family regulator
MNTPSLDAIFSALSDPTRRAILARLAEGDGRTLQHFHQKGFPTTELRDGHVSGWNSAFTKEIRYTETLALKENRP